MRSVTKVFIIELDKLERTSFILNLTDGMIVCEGRSNEMKKTIAVLMLGSALLLPNNNSVEASYSNKEVQVQKAQYVQVYGLGGNQYNIDISEQLNQYIKTYQSV
jgi:hypothetical protein